VAASPVSAAGRAAGIASAWAQVSEEDIEMGRKAYFVYHQTLRALAQCYGALFIPTVEAFVAMSPNNDYHGNLRSLVSVMIAMQHGLTFDDCVISTYRACGKRAWGYLSGEVSFLDTVKGKKITSFRDNILYLDDSKRVTVDGHMIAIAAGKNMTMTEANYLLRDGRFYGHVEQAVQALSRSVGLAPCVTQATLWTWRKRTMGIKFDSQVDMFTSGTRWDRVLHPEEILPYTRALQADPPAQLRTTQKTLWSNHGRDLS